MLPRFDLVIGTIEEFNIAGGSDDIMRSLAAVRACSNAVLVVKRGAAGLRGHRRRDPGVARRRVQRRGRSRRRAERARRRRRVLVGLPVGLGARRGLRRVRALCERVRRARRVAPWLRAGDADARRARLFHRERRADSASRPGCDADAAASRHGAAHAARRSARVRVRSPQPVLRSRAADGRRRGAHPAAESAVRRSGRRTSNRRAGCRAASACCATTATARTRSTPRPDAAGGSAGRSSCPAPIRSRSIAAARSARTLASWPQEHVVKCLVQYHPDDAIDNRLEQEAQIRALYDAVQASGHELLLEIIPPKSMPREPDTVLPRDEAALQPRASIPNGGSSSRWTRRSGRRSTR